jgi:hypothetical protein
VIFLRSGLYPDRAGLRAGNDKVIKTTVRSLGSTNNVALTDVSAIEQTGRHFPAAFQLLTQSRHHSAVNHGPVLRRGRRERI